MAKFTIAYITHKDGKIETRTYCTSNPNDFKALLALLYEIASGMTYKQVTFAKHD